MRPFPDFHNTPARYRQFHKALEEDKLGRGPGVQKEIDFFLTRESGAGLLVDLLAEGKLPLLVTHNDTMLNNVLFDRHLPEGGVRGGSGHGDAGSVGLRLWRLHSLWRQPGGGG